MKLIILIIVCMLGTIASSLPQYYNRNTRVLRTPQRTVMLSGYYRTPYRQSYIPQTAMTAFASGSDTITTGTFNNGEESLSNSNPEDDSRNEVLKPIEPNEEEDAPPIINEEDENEPATTEAAIASTTRKFKQNPKRRKRPQIEEDEENDQDEGDSWSFGRPSRRQNVVPNISIMFGSSFGRSTDGGPPGTATAIANSFSTGNGGVASSHATAFGDPDAYRKWKSNLRRREQTD